MGGPPDTASAACDRLAYVLYTPQGPRPLDGLQTSSTLQPAAPPPHRPQPATRRALLRHSAEVSTVYDKISRSQLLHIPAYTFVSFLAAGSRRGGAGPSPSHRVVVLQFRSGGTDMLRHDLAPAPPAMAPMPFEALTITFTISDAGGTRRLVLSSSVRELERHAHHVKLPLRCLPRERWVNLFVDVAALYHSLLSVTRDDAQSWPRPPATPTSDRFRLTGLQIGGSGGIYVRRVLSLHTLPELLCSEVNRSDGAWRGGHMPAETTLVSLPCLEPLRLTAEVQQEAVFLSLRSGHEPFLTAPSAPPACPARSASPGVASMADKAAAQTPISSSYVAPPLPTTAAAHPATRAAPQPSRGLRQRCANELTRCKKATPKTTPRASEADCDASLVAELRAQLRPALSHATPSPPLACRSSSSLPRQPSHRHETRCVAASSPTTGGMKDVDAKEEEMEDEKFVVQEPRYAVCPARPELLCACNNDVVDANGAEERAPSSQTIIRLLQQRIAHLDRVLDDVGAVGDTAPSTPVLAEPPHKSAAPMATSAVLAEKEDAKCDEVTIACAGCRSERVTRCDKAIQTGLQAAAAVSLSPWAPFTREPAYILAPTHTPTSAHVTRDAHDDTASAPSTTIPATRCATEGEVQVKATSTSHNSAPECETRRTVHERRGLPVCSLLRNTPHPVCMADAGSALREAALPRATRGEMTTSWSFHSDPCLALDCDDDDDNSTASLTHLAGAAAADACSAVTAVHDVDEQEASKLAARSRCEECGTPASRPPVLQPSPSVAEDSVQVSGPSSPVCDARVARGQTAHARIATAALRRAAPLPRHPDVSETPRMRAARLSAHANTIMTGTTLVTQIPAAVTGQHADLTTAAVHELGSSLVGSEVHGAAVPQTMARGTVSVVLRTPTPRERCESNVVAAAPPFSAHSTPSSFHCISPSQLPAPRLQVSRYEGSLMAASSTMPDALLASVSREESNATRNSDFAVHHPPLPALPPPPANKTVTVAELMYDPVVQCYLDLQTNQYVFGVPLLGNDSDRDT